jgi:hypothetical protein
MLPAEKLVSVLVSVGYAIRCVWLRGAAETKAHGTLINTSCFRYAALRSGMARNALDGF